MSINLLDDTNSQDDTWRNDSRQIKKYSFVHKFLPSSQKKERSVFLSHNFLFSYSFVALLAAAILRTFPVVMPGVLGYASNITVNDLLNYTNKKREEAGLSSLTINSALTRAAEEKAEHMFQNNYWAHISPQGVEPWDFILGQKYDYTYAGENLAKNFSTSKDVVQAWYESPSHKENLVNKNYTEVGYAVVNGTLNGYETTLVVQMFGRPREATQVAAVPDVDIQPSTVEVPVVAEKPQEVPQLAPAQLPTPVSRGFVDVAFVTKMLSLTMTLFVLSLLGLDVWYSQRKGIVKVNGHTLAHVAFLVLVVVSIWFVIKPGAVL